MASQDRIMDKRNPSEIHQKWTVFESFLRKHQNSSCCLIFKFVIRKWPFWTHCGQSRHFGRYRSWYGVVNQKNRTWGRLPCSCSISYTFWRPCSPTLGQVDLFSWTETCPLSHPVPPNLVPPNLKTTLSQSHPVPPHTENPLSLSHLSHVLQPVLICPIWFHYLSFPNSLCSDFFFGVLIVIPHLEKHFWLKCLLHFFNVLSCSRWSITSKLPPKDRRQP